MSEEHNPLEISEHPVESPGESDNLTPEGTAAGEPLESPDGEGQLTGDDRSIGTETKDSPEEQAVETLFPDPALVALQQRVETLEQQLEERDARVENFKKDYTRLAADFDNFRKRTSKEKEELETKIKGKTLLEILAVVDNFERARTGIKPANEGEMNIHKSYQGVYKTLVDSLKRLGVSPMRPEGQPFDPTYHEAMMREYTDEYPEGTVTEQLVRGYVLDDRVLRHALVKVAAPPDTDPNADSSERAAETTADR
ncbi:nucleotide exchange factor GrpE [Pannus brasiliensis]